MATLAFETVYTTNGGGNATRINLSDDSLTNVIITFDDAGVSVGGTVTVEVNGTDQGSFTYTGQDAAGNIIVTDGDGDVFLISNDTAIPFNSAVAVTDTSDLTCFAAGTLIATVNGDVAVEELKAGDEVLTASGETTTVKWVGRQTRSSIFGDEARICPIRISAGALGENVPARDLVVTGDHGMVFDEAIVHASALVNGTTITRVARAELATNVTYFHVETEGHAVILAEGAAAESFIDNVSRELFDNYAEFEAAFGAEQDDIQPLDLPRAKGPRQVPAAIKARIAERAAVLVADVA